MKLNKFNLLLLLFIYLNFNSIAQIWKPVTTDDFYYVGGAGVASMIVDSATNTLIVGGLFDSIGSVPAKNIARWDGVNFTPLGSGFPFYLTCLAIFNGEIYASGVIANNYKIYKYDGSSWSIFANPNDRVNCLKVHNDKLYAGGNFLVIDGVLLKGIGVYDGVSWSDIGGGVDDPGCGFCSWVDDIEFVDSLIYIGGSFETAGSASAINVAKWDGTTWSGLGSGMTGGWVWSIKEYNNELYAGGNFDFADGLSIPNIAKWNGSNWSNVGDGLNGYSACFLNFNSSLYTTAGGFSGANFVGRPANWNGLAWNMTAGGTLAGPITLCAFNNEVYMGMSGWHYYGTDSLNGVIRLGILEFQTQNSICGNNCNGTATITDSVGVPPYSYMWSNGATTQTVTGLCAGVYTVSVTDGGGSVTEGSVTIDGPQAIQITATTTNASCSTCNTGTATVNANGGTPPYNYEWSNGATTNSIDSLMQGEYYLTVTDSSGCVVFDTMAVGFDVGVNQLAVGNRQFSVFPNPANETITVILQQAQNDIAEITIENYLGQAIQTLQITNNQKQTINISNYPSGMYFIKCFDGNELRVLKLVKE